jgi:lysophospholipase L1-like esterase
VSITHFSSTDVATPASFVLTTTRPVTEIRIHSYAQSGGGSFRWRIDGGAWTTVSTDGAAGLLVTTIGGLSAATHVLNVEATVAGAQGLTMIGADLRLAGLGVRVHKAGNGSSEVLDWVAVDAATWQAGLAALAPNLCIIILGTNDKTAVRVPDAYAANLTILIGRIRAAMPLCDVLLLSPADTGDIKTYPTAAFDAAMRATAAANNCAMVSGYMGLGLNANAIARGLMDPLATGNSRHLTDEGGRVFANLLLHALRVS